MWTIPMLSGSLLILGENVRLSSHKLSLNTIMSCLYAVLIRNFLLYVVSYSPEE